MAVKYEMIDWLDLAESFNIVAPEELEVSIHEGGDTQIFKLTERDEILKHLVCKYINSKLDRETEKLDVEVKQTLSEFISDLLEITKEQHKQCIYTCMLNIEEDIEFVTFITDNIQYMYESFEINYKD